MNSLRNKCMVGKYYYKGNSLHNCEVYEEDTCLFSLYTELEAKMVVDKLNSLDLEIDVFRKENRELIIENNKLIELLSEFTPLVNVCRDYNIPISALPDTLEEYIERDQP